MTEIEQADRADEQWKRIRRNIGDVAIGFDPDEQADAIWLLLQSFKKAKETA